MPTDFQKKVYKILKKVPKGKITTYGDIAKKLKNFPRAVGNALNKNPYSFSKKGKIPCHRVIKSTGEIGGFASGTKNKILLLKREGVEIRNKRIDLDRFGFEFN